MERLLIAEAYKCGADQHAVVVNAEIKARDGGQDAYTPAPARPSPWLGDVETCWQFKAGSAGEAAALRGEITKDLPSDILANGGRYVLVAADVSNGETGRAARLKVLRDEARSAGLPTDRIEVMTGGEQLVTWINEHPSIAIGLLGVPEGLLPFTTWAGTRCHQGPYVPTASLTGAMTDVRLALDAGAEPPWHVHVSGPPGVGKTRFVLETCRGAGWQEEVVYIPQAPRLDARALVDIASDNPAVRSVVVADEVSEHDLSALSEAVERADGRVRLVTIGHTHARDSERVKEVRVDPLDRDATVKFISGLHPAMPVEHCRFVARVSGGYVRLARLMADAVQNNPELSTVDLLSLEGSRRLMKEMLGGRDYTSLLVLAVLESVGWTGDHANEGSSITEHVGLNWATVQADVRRFHEDFGVAPRGGDYRYISPAPLGLFLAREAWESWKDRLRTLPEKLPKEARDKFYARLRSLATTGAVAEFCREELDRFFSLSDFASRYDVRRWEAMSASDPERAVRLLHETLQRASHDERIAFPPGARREMVWALVRAAWPSATFEDAALALAELAEAETETWSNNATGEFIARFSPVLGGTGKPYVDRLAVLDQLLERQEPGYRSLAVRALSVVGQQHVSRADPGLSDARVTEPEWHPSGRDQLDAVLASIDRLRRLVDRDVGDIADALLETVRTCSWLLLEKPTQPAFADLLIALRRALPGLRESIESEVSGFVDRREKYGRHDIDTEVLANARVTLLQLRDDSVEGEIRRLSRCAEWGENLPSAELRSLALRLVADSRALWNTWAWLTSGEAAGAWALGLALGEADETGSLMPSLVRAEKRGVDARVISAYLTARASEVGQDAIETIIDDYESSNPNDLSLLVDLTWRVSRGDRAADRALRLLKHGNLPAGGLDVLVYGSWLKDVSEQRFLDLVRELVARPEHRGTAVNLLDDWLRAVPERLPAAADLATQLARDSSLIRAGQMTSHHWSQVAECVAPSSARSVTRAIFDAQAETGKQHWFLEYSEAAEVLQVCVRTDPDGVWAELTRYLEDSNVAPFFVVGIPRGIVDQLPRTDVMTWIREDPVERSCIMANLASKELHDDALVVQVLQEFGGNDAVRSAFRSAFWSGSWFGSSAERFSNLAVKLEASALATVHARFRDWALETARTFRKEADRERKCEDEEALGRGTS